MRSALSSACEWPVGLFKAVLAGEAAGDLRTGGAKYPDLMAFF